MPENEKKKEALKVFVADSILVSDAVKMSVSDISVSAVGPDGVERETVWPDTTPSDVIATSTAADLGVQMEPSYQERFIESIEKVKGKYFEEVEISFWPPKIKIKRAPEKIVQYIKIKEAKIKKAKETNSE